MAASLARVAVTLACAVLASGCAGVFGDGELSSEERARVEQAYAFFLQASFPADATGSLSVQRYRYDPGADDLDVSFTLLRDRVSGPPRIRLLMADGMPVYRQLEWLVGSAPGTPAADLVARLQLIRKELTVESCPELAWIEPHWSSEWLLTTLPNRSAGKADLPHGTVARIEVRDASRITSLAAWDEGEPAYRWAGQAVERVLRCASERS
jgi:hypothetical protein